MKWKSSLFSWILPKLKLKLSRYFFIITLVLYSGSLSYAADDLYNAFKEGKFNGTFKLLAYERDFDLEGKIDYKDIAIGGHMQYETAPLYGFSGGFGFKTAQGSQWHDEDYGVYPYMFATGATSKDAENFTALNQYYIRYSGYDTEITVGAQYVNTPLLAGKDIRLTPISYRGYTLVNKSIPKVELRAMYITDYMHYAFDSYEPISTGLRGAAKNSDEGVLVGGVIWSPIKGLRAQLWGYNFRDAFNSIYLRGSYQTKPWTDTVRGNGSKGFGYSIDAQYMKQDDSGDAIAGKIDTDQMGIRLGASAYGFYLQGIFGTVGDQTLKGIKYAANFSQMQVQALTAAERDVYGLKLGYNFGQIGAEGLSAYAWHSKFDSPDSGINSATDFTETDFNLQYKLKGALKNFTVRLRHAIIDYDDYGSKNQDYTDSRLYIIYRF
ncbi:MAG TPA: OprD family outer membrane porin [Desulfobacteraceae bacterium]|nr:OprD family outer membrane porin [Desulfobacteraceae bacterium]HPJ68831.1 OprD family outer membrane porin [Desulfobacteraceae bacterium]HPQ26903.1 OprD family outer membrane porin [Desulfobacteraceae bacterium]